MPKRDRAEYMRQYRARQRRERPIDAALLAALESPEADWRRMHPSAALVELARSLRDMEPDDGEGIIPPRPSTLAAPDARWRTLAPRSAFFSLTGAIAATLTPGYSPPCRGGRRVVA